MIMSRRKQLRPKSLKDDDAMIFVLPDELKRDEESNDIIARIDLKQDHQFGPFPAMIVQDSIKQIEDRIECFQLLDIKHNWLSQCSILDQFSSNLNLIFKDNEIFVSVTKSISIGTRLCTNTIILPKVIMNNDIKIKEEPIESEIKIKFPNPKETKKYYPLAFACDTCGIRFSNRDTLDAHRQHYCTKQEITKSHLTDLTDTVKVKSMKRKSPDMTDLSSPSTKRLSLLSNETYCRECDTLLSKTDNILQHKLYCCGTNSSAGKLKNKTISFDRPIKIGPYIYVPIPIISSQVDAAPPNHDNKPLDLSKPKIINEKSTISLNSPLDLSIEKTIVQQQIYQCDYCSIRFSSLKTLHAHQDNYCFEYQKQKKMEKNEIKSITVNHNRSQSPSSVVSKILPNDSLNPSHRSSLFICRLCKYRGNTIRGMRMHFKLHLSNNEPCTDDDIITKSINNPLSSIPPTNQLLLKCKICSAMFDYEDALLNHTKCVHTNETLLECLECQSRFCSKWNLIRHMRLAHTNIKYDEEEEDNQHNKLNENDKSSNSMNLIRHIINLPNKITIKRKFTCPYCQIKFGSTDTLKQHMITYCSSRSTTNDLLNNIKKEKKNDFYCSSCQISFQHKTSYDAHKRYYCHGDSKARIKIQV